MAQKENSTKKAINFKVVLRKKNGQIYTLNTVWG